MLGDSDGQAAELWRMAGLGTPMAIRTAATLRLADHIQAGHGELTDLAAQCEADPTALRRLVAYLAVRGVLDYDHNGHVILTDLGRPLLSTHPSGVREWFDIQTGGRGELSFVELLHSVRTGQAAFPVRYGTDFWDDLAADPDRVEAFNRRLGTDVASRSAQILNAVDWKQHSTVLDIGGGDGSLLLSLLEANPHLSGAIYDLEGACLSAQQNFASSPAGGRARTLQGSFFDPIPTGFDVYVLSLVLHDWQDQECIQILRRCREAAANSSRVLLIETVAADGFRVHTGMDLRMLVIYGAQERTADQLAALGHAAGLQISAVTPAGDSTVVELRPEAALQDAV